MRSTQHNRAELAELRLAVQRDPACAWPTAAGTCRAWAGLLAISCEINRQAAMIAYVNDFHIMTLLGLRGLPLILLARSVRTP